MNFRYFPLAALAEGGLRAQDDMAHAVVVIALCILIGLIAIGIRGCPAWLSDDIQEPAVCTSDTPASAQRESRESPFSTNTTGENQPGRVGRVAARATAHARQTPKGESGESFSGRESRESPFRGAPLARALQARNRANPSHTRGCCAQEAR